MQIVSCIVSGCIGIFTVLTFSYLVKYWIDNRLSDTIRNVEKDIVDEKKRLKEKVQTLENLVKSYQSLLEKQNQELSESLSKIEMHSTDFTKEDVCTILDELLTFAKENEAKNFTELEVTDFVDFNSLIGYITSLKKIYGLEDKKYD